MSEQSDLAKTHGKPAFSALMLGALGVVFGDIGTSPLYTLHECFAEGHGVPLNENNILGVLSLIFWSITLVVSVKYVLIAMRASNRGEGGSLALLALLLHLRAKRPWLVPVVSTLGIMAAALFYGDSTVTPAVSVLSAIEGLKVAAPSLDDYIIPATITILLVLFMIQKNGSGMVGKLFSPIMIGWFLVLAILGLSNIAKAPMVLAGISPHYAVLFLWEHQLAGFLSLGSVVLAVTGGEALFADMGHFRRGPIVAVWYSLVLPSLVFNYFGQGALLVSQPEAITNPFFLLAPEWALIPLVFLAATAACIASQAVITGAFSVTAQAIQMGYLPRLRILHTSAQQKGQIYIPFLNWMLALVIIALVLGFGSSSKLTAAYGIAVTGTMTITSILLVLMAALVWRWRNPLAYALLGLFLVIDLAFLFATLSKFIHGGWFPVALGAVMFVLFTTWKKGRDLAARRGLSQKTEPDAFFEAAVNSPNISRPKGTAMFLTADRYSVPEALMQNMKHNQVLHERTVLLTIVIDDIAHLSTEERIESENMGNGVYRLVLYYGYMDDSNVPRTLANASAAQLGFFYEPMGISYFLSRETIISGAEPGISHMRERLFSWMLRSAAPSMESFSLPVNRVVELGSQIEI